MLDKPQLRHSVHDSGEYAKNPFYLGLAYAKERVGFLLDAEQRIFHVLHKGQVLKQFEIPNLVAQTLTFNDYLKKMLLEARQYMQV